MRSLQRGLGGHSGDKLSRKDILIDILKMSESYRRFAFMQRSVQFSFPFSARNLIFCGIFM
jgi:ABC-type hemin transport system ATPase subunit